MPHAHVTQSQFSIASALRRCGTVIGICALAASSLVVTPPAAQASPDQDKNVFTRQHVDAPVPAWDPSTKSLYILANNALAKDSVLYLGRGWRGNIPKHIFRVPGNDDRLGFLGEPGKRWLSAPQDPGTGNAPIWAGIGVDGSLSSIANELENGNYVLDLVDVNGPGRVESFIVTPWRVNRLWSSDNLDHRTVWNPRHMHAYTLFSKPGRYELNVAAVTRSADGTSIYTSPITPIVWQVGGTDPRQTTILDYGQTYNTARPKRPDGKAQGGTLTVAPKTNFVTAGDDVLTDFSFTTGNSTDQGRLIVLIDGYYMTEVAVENGRAYFDEMIGDEESTFQAIYIPTDATSARYATDTVTTTRTVAQARSTTGKVDAPVTPQAQPSPELTPGEHRADNGEVTVTITPIEGDDYTINVQGAPGFDAEMLMSWHPRKDTNIPDCSVERRVVGGQLTVNADIHYCRNSAVMRVTFNPHPYSNVKPQNFELDDFNFENGCTYQFTLPLREDDTEHTQPERLSAWRVTPYDPASENAPVLSIPAESDAKTSDTHQTDPHNTNGTTPPSDQPNPTQPNTAHNDTENTDGPLLNDPIKIHRGHLDIRLSPVENNKWALAIKDDSLIAASGSVYRHPEAVTIAVPAAARMTRNHSLASPALDFLGPIGTTNYVLPDTEREGLPWPGFSTEDVDYTQYPQGIDYQLTVRSAPNNGRMLFVTTADLGEQVTIHVDSRNPKLNHVHTEEATHLHGTWVFSQPGRYEVDIAARSGQTTLAIGKLTFDVDPKAAASAHSEPSTQPQTTPSSTSAMNGAQTGTSTLLLQNPSKKKNRATGAKPATPGSAKPVETPENANTQRRPNTAARRAGANAVVRAQTSALPAQRGVLGVGAASGAPTHAQRAASADAAQSGQAANLLSPSVKGRLQAHGTLNGSHSGADIYQSDLGAVVNGMASLSENPQSATDTSQSTTPNNTGLYLVTVALATSLLVSIAIAIRNRH